MVFEWKILVQYYFGNFIKTRRTLNRAYLISQSPFVIGVKVSKQGICRKMSGEGKLSHKFKCYEFIIKQINVIHII